MKKFTVAAAALLTTTALAHAGGLDRSGQSISPLFEAGGETGSYAQLSFGRVDPTANNATVNDPLSTYSQAGFAFKTNLGSNLSAALVMDQPFGAEVSYSNIITGAGASVTTTGFTALLRYKTDSGFSVHGGLRSLTGSGGVNVLTHEVSNATGSGNGYVFGAAYEIPDIAMRVALTYNSSIKTSFTATERVGAVVTPNIAFDIEFPESVNLEFQTGIAADTLLTGSVRYVGWNGFSFATAANNYATFTEDSYTYSLGVGRRLTDSFAMSATLGYEAGGSRPSTTALAPTTGQTTLTLAGSYTRDNMTISGGLTLGRPGDQDVLFPGIGSQTFSGNTVVGAGVRLGFNF